MTCVFEIVSIIDVSITVNMTPVKITPINASIISFHVVIVKHFSVVVITFARVVVVVVVGVLVFVINFIGVVVFRVMVY